MYNEAIASGASPRLAEMFATQQAPRAKSDATFFAGMDTGGGNIKNPLTRKMYLDEAKKAGVDVTGAVYYSEIAAFPGDPEAWVRSRGEITGLVEKRGWNMDGDLKAGGEPKDDVSPGQGPKIAPDVVEQLVNQRIEAGSTEKTDNLIGDVITKHQAPY